MKSMKTLLRVVLALFLGYLIADIPWVFYNLIQTVFMVDINWLGYLSGISFVPIMIISAILIYTRMSKKNAENSS